MQVILTGKHFMFGFSPSKTLKCRQMGKGVEIQLEKKKYLDVICELEELGRCN